MGIKFYDNPQRTIPKPEGAYQPYVPQYQTRGIKPEETLSATDKRRFNTHNKPMLVKGKPDMFKAETPSIGRNMPFAELPQEHTTMTTMPNIGNNMENTWATLDGQVIDDIGLVDDQAPMIDNNDYVEYVQTNEDIVPETPAAPTQLQDDEYLLSIDETIIATGDITFIEGEVRDLVFGDHQLCEGKTISVDRLMVLRRAKIKVGVFIDG